MTEAQTFIPSCWSQARAYLSPAPELLVSGHLGSSKTRTAGEKADARCRSYPNARVALTRKRRVDLGLTTLRTLLEQVIEPPLRQFGWRPAAEGGSTLFYPNGSPHPCARGGG